MEEVSINNIDTKIDKKTVEEAIQFILEEGKELGYQEAIKIYGKQYKELIRKGRKQGVVIGILSSICAFYAYKEIKNRMREKIKEEEESKKPYDVDVEDVKEE